MARSAVDPIARPGDAPPARRCRPTARAARRPAGGPAARPARRPARARPRRAARATAPAPGTRPLDGAAGPRRTSSGTSVPACRWSRVRGSAPGSAVTSARRSVREPWRGGLALQGLRLGHRAGGTSTRPAGRSVRRRRRRAGAPGRRRRWSMPAAVSNRRRGDGPALHQQRQPGVLGDERGRLSAWPGERGAAAAAAARRPTRPAARDPARGRTTRARQRPDAARSGCRRARGRHGDEATEVGITAPSSTRPSDARRSSARDAAGSPSSARAAAGAGTPAPATRPTRPATASSPPGRRPRARPPPRRWWRRARRRPGPTGPAPALARWSQQVSPPR